MPAIALTVGSRLAVEFDRAAQAARAEEVERLRIMPAEIRDLPVAWRKCRVELPDQRTAAVEPIQRQVRVYTAQGRFTGYLLAALPLVLGSVIYLLNREYVSILWAEQIGRVMIAIALLLQITGFFVIRRIVDIDV